MNDDMMVLMMMCGGDDGGIVLTTTVMVFNGHCIQCKSKPFLSTYGSILHGISRNINLSLFPSLF